MKKSFPLLVFGTGVAFGFFALIFRGPRKYFWSRMTGAGITLGSLALAAQPKLRKTRLGIKEIGLGLGLAGLLYGIFQLGDRLAHRIIPGGGQQIEAIYGLNRLRPRRELMIRLGLVIGPSEEFFWRGFLQDGLMEHFGRLPGTLMGIATYGCAHFFSGNFTMIVAATMAGAFWGGLYGLGVPLGALIVSHAIWDNLIFLIAPTIPGNTRYE
jgi:membrane protease YdiL (CAAX protease family)